MVNKIKGQYKTILVVGALVAIMVLEVFFAPTTVATAGSSTWDRYDNPTEVEVKVDPYEESKKIADEQVKEIEAEGTKVENQTVAGEKTSVGGLYLANKVKGVAVKPDTSNEGSPSLYIETLNTDAKKSSAAMASIENAAKEGGPLIDGVPMGLEVGPVVDVYFKKTENGKLVTGSANDVDTIKIGIPDNYQEEGYYYGYIIVFPGGRVVRQTSWNDSGLGTKYISVNMVDIDYKGSVQDLSQATIAITRYKDPMYEYNKKNNSN